MAFNFSLLIAFSYLSSYIKWIYSFVQRHSANQVIVLFWISVFKCNIFCSDLKVLVLSFNLNKCHKWLPQPSITGCAVRSVFCRNMAMTTLISNRVCAWTETFTLLACSWQTFGCKLINTTTNSPGPWCGEWCTPRTALNRQYGCSSPVLRIKRV